MGRAVFRGAIRHGRRCGAYEVSARDNQPLRRLKDCRTPPGWSAAPVFQARAGRFFVSPAEYFQFLDHPLLSAAQPFDEDPRRNLKSVTPHHFGTELRT